MRAEQATPIGAAADADTGGRRCSLRRVGRPVTAAAFDGHGLRQPPMAIGCRFLSKVLMAAFAAGAVSLAYPTIWQLSATMGPWRLSVATILASAAMIAWLILDHELWERPHSADEHERAVLYNAATVVTLTIGVAILHLGLFILQLVTAWWTLPPQMVADNIGHPVGLSTLLMMAWLVAAVATLGGALGSGMEDDEAVKAAAYGVRQRRRFDKSKLTHVSPAVSRRATQAGWVLRLVRRSVFAGHLEHGGRGRRHAAQPRLTGAVTRRELVKLPRRFLSIFAAS